MIPDGEVLKASDVLDEALRCPRGRRVIGGATASTLAAMTLIELREINQNLATLLDLVAMESGWTAPWRDQGRPAAGSPSGVSEGPWAPSPLDDPSGGDSEASSSAGAADLSRRPGHLVTFGVAAASGLAGAAATALAGGWLL